MDYFNYNRNGRAETPRRESRSETVANRELAGWPSISAEQRAQAEAILSERGDLELAE